MVSKRFDLSVEDAICLEKAWGWGLIALAIESGCQLASSDNCFPWQDPVGREKRSTVWRVNAGIHFHRSPVIIVSWARGYLLPICVRAKHWLTPIDQRDQGMEGGRGEGFGRPWVSLWLSLKDEKWRIEGMMGRWGRKQRGEEKEKRGNDNYYCNVLV